MNHILLGENQAGAKIVVAIVGAIVVAVRHTAVLRIVVPATATVHAVRPFGYYPLFKEHNRFSKYFPKIIEQRSYYLLLIQGIIYE